MQATSPELMKITTIEEMTKAHPNANGLVKHLGSAFKERPSAYRHGTDQGHYCLTWIGGHQMLIYYKKQTAFGITTSWGKCFGWNGDQWRELSIP